MKALAPHDGMIYAYINAPVKERQFQKDFVTSTGMNSLQDDEVQQNKD